MSMHDCVSCLDTTVPHVQHDMRCVLMPTSRGVFLTCHLKVIFGVF
jgi:hypothetical protein